MKSYSFLKKFFSTLFLIEICRIPRFILGVLNALWNAEIKIFDTTYVLLKIHVSFSNSDYDQNKAQIPRISFFLRHFWHLPITGLTAGVEANKKKAVRWGGEI